jgi:hypothetical protein
MRQFLAAAGLALALATPAFAQVSPDYPATDPLSNTPRIRAEQEWWRLVAKTNADRQERAQEQQQPSTLPVPQRAAINNGASATDAAVGSPTVIGTRPNLVAGCPGTNEADQPYQSGGYCLPGGR